MLNRKVTNKGQFAKRGIRRALFTPLFYIPEGPPKMAARRLMLTGQNSLPTEFAVNKGETIVQIGTPWPKTMLRFLRRISSTGRLVIVEAMPENQARLQAEIDRLNLTNVTLIRGAACNENRKGTLKISPHSGDHRIPLEGILMDNDLRKENLQMMKIDVNFVRLDDELEALGLTKVDYLSVTVNGAEAEVLRGAAETLKRSDPNTRVYAKGHALDENNLPIHLQSKEILEQIGYDTVITKGEPSSADNSEWTLRAGDIFAWKQ